jgi:hypothetical protein
MDGELIVGHATIARAPARPQARIVGATAHAAPA